jgi:hypothetical protein
MLTLNQTIEILKNFSLNHKQLGRGTSNKHFYFGDKWEVNDNDDLNYPLMWVSLLPTQYDKSGLVTNKFQIDISDKVNKDESNETHVLSDTQSICFDLLNYLEQVADSGEIGMLFGSTSELTDYTEDRDDMVSGWFFTTEIKTHLSSSSCNLPMLSGNILDDNYIYVGGTTAGNFLVEIKDQDGNVLQSFDTSGQYVVTVLSGIQQVIGNTNTTITQDIID